MSRRKRSGAPYSLFPFLNVLACLMGALTLMIGASAYAHIGRQAAPAAAKRAEELAKMQQQLSGLAAEMSILGSRKEIADQVNSRLSLATAELDLLRPQLAEHQKKKQADAALESELKTRMAALDVRVAQLQSELERHAAKNRSLQSELERRTAPPPDPTIRIRPSSGGRNIDPIFVECRSDGILLYGQAKPALVPASDVKKNPTFLGLLDQAAKDEATVVFLVRNDGISTYFVARDAARSKKCRNGKLPIIGQGDIDLSLITKADEDKSQREHPVESNEK